MRAASILARIFVFILAFTLGFLSCVGVLVGGGYFAYKKVSLDKLGVSTDRFLADDAEVDVSALPIQGLISELSSLKSAKITVDFLVERYGLILPEQIENLLTENMREKELTKLFSKDGIRDFLSELYFGKLFGFEQKENPNYSIVDPDGEPRLIWVDPETGERVGGVNGVLADMSIAEFLDNGVPMDDIMEDLTVGELMELEAKTGLPTFIKEKNGTLTPVEDMEPITVWYDKNGNEVTSVVGAIADMSVSELTAGLDDISLGKIFGTVEYKDKYYTYEIRRSLDEHIVLTEEESLVSEFSDLSIDGLTGDKINDRVNNVQISSILGYKQDAVTGEWLDSEGNKVNSIMAQLASSKVGDLNDTINGLSFGDIAELVAVDADGNVIEDLADYEGEITWYEKGYKKGASDNVLAEGLMASFAELAVKDINDSAAITDAVKNTVVGDALGYVKVDGIWYTDDTYSKKISGVMATLAGSKVGSMTEEVDKITLADIADMEKVYYLKADDSKVDAEDIGNYAEDALYFVWEQNGVKASGVMAGLAHLTLADLDDEATVSKAVKDLHVGDAMGYEKVKGIWYEKYEGVGDPDNKELTGLVKAIADSEVRDLNDDIQTMKFGTVAGFTFDSASGKWKDGTEDATGINAALADLTVGKMSDPEALSAAIKKVTVADAMGYTKTADGYKDGNDLVEGFMAVIADKQISDVQETLDETAIGEFIGYEKDGTGVWKKNGVAADGLLQKVYSRNINELDGLLSTLELQDVIESRSGLLSIVPANTKVVDLDKTIKDMFTDANGKSVTMGQLEDANLIHVEGGLSDTMRSWTFKTFMTKANDALSALGH